MPILSYRRPADDVRLEASLATAPTTIRFSDPHAGISIHDSTVSSFIMIACSADLGLPIRYAHTRHHALRALGITQYKHFRMISTLQHCICRNKLSTGDIHHPKTDIISASGLISSLHNELRRLWLTAPLNTPSLGL